uniref:Transthyretin-like family protein n=1 Tax=Ditylenchus dipsaci TaxID=166011 RepID=A0A915EK74_9BILA
MANTVVVKCEMRIPTDINENRDQVMESQIPKESFLAVAGLMALRVLSLITFAFACCCVTGMREQAVAVKGILLCGASPASGVHVKLWDEDKGPDPDDVLDDGHTDSSGSFHLKGATRELTGIDPILKIYHDCDDGIMPGQRKVKLHIPSSYVSAGGSAKRVFDVGTLNLETVFPNEERDLV